MSACEAVDAVVIGAGVVGLAVARALAIAGRDVTIVEAGGAFGTGISSRNSEVIHAGLYYPPGSAKARLCIRGRELLYAYCAERHVPHRRIGKLLIAAHDAERPALAALHHNARACGITDLEPLVPDGVAAIEPALTCVAALWSPSTGIVDSHGLMTALLSDAEAHGAVLALSSAVRGGAVVRDGIELRVVSGHPDPAADPAADPDAYADADADAITLRARLVVNCAGLAAAAVAASIAGFPAAHVPRMRYAKGHYFALSGRAPFRHLVYPMPESGGLGVHVTLDLGGAVRFGPDVEWLADGAPFDDRVDAARAATFAAAIRRYWPALDADALVPAYTGVRPKLSGPGDPPADFAITGPAEHGVDGLVHCFGIESPGLTSSLAIGESIAALVDDDAARRPNGSSIRTMPVVAEAPILR